MKEKILAVMSAVMLMVSTSVTAFAASPTVGTTENPVASQEAATEVDQTGSASEYKDETVVSGGFYVTKVSDTTVASAGVAVQNLLLNDLAKTGTLLGNAGIAGAAGNSASKVTATVLSVIDVNPSGATKNADGLYELTLDVPGISAGDTIAILHYGANGWEVIVPYAVGENAVAFRSASLSPIAVVKISVAGQASTGAAPRTGETIPAGVIALICVGTAGAFVTGRKLKAARQ